MNASKRIQLINYFTFLTFLTSTVLVSLVYFSPSQSIVNWTIIYGLVYGSSTLILVSVGAYHFFRNVNNRRGWLIALVVLVGNSAIGVSYFFLCNYAMGTILVKITNNTGRDVSDVGIYGCSQQNWGELRQGESKTVRFAGNTDCLFIVTYKLNGVVKHEVLPKNYFTTNRYQLGENPDVELAE